MSKFDGKQTTNSKEFDEKEIDSMDNSFGGALDSTIYKAENSYFQYLRAVKFENSNDASDFSTVFMTF